MCSATGKKKIKKAGEAGTASGTGKKRRRGDFIVEAGC
jgi:hypothetical protein